jgi:hypothetical protein
MAIRTAGIKSVSGFDSNIRKSACQTGIRVLEANHWFFAIVSKVAPHAILFEPVTHECPCSP